MPRSWTWLFWDLGKGRRIIVAPCGMQCYAKEKDDDGADDEDAGGPADAFPAGVGGSHDASVTAVVPTMHRLPMNSPVFG
jgi:hypothetical protein